MAPRVFDVIPSMRPTVQTNAAYFIWVIVLQIEAVSGPAAAAVMTRALERGLVLDEGLVDIFWSGSQCLQALLRRDRTESDKAIVSRFFI